MSYTFDFGALLPFWPVFLEGAWLTLKLSALATVFGAGVAALYTVEQALEVGVQKNVRPQGGVEQRGIGNGHEKLLG